MLRLIPGYRRSEPPAPEPQPDDLAGLGRAVVAGDEAALRTFLAAVVPHLLRVARRVLGSEHPELEDVAYEAAFAVMQGLPKFRGEGTLLHFACRVGVLTAMNVRRRDAAQKRARTQQACDPDTLADEALDPEELASASALAPLVRELLDTLPEPLAEALALHLMLGYTMQEVADLCGAPLETVRSRLRLAKQALRRRALSHPSLQEVAEPLRLKELP